MLAPLRDAFERDNRDPDIIQVLIAGATKDPDGLRNLESEGVGHACLTIRSEDRDEIPRRLDDYTGFLEQFRGTRKRASGMNHCGDSC